MPLAIVEDRRLGCDRRDIPISRRAVAPRAAAHCLTTAGVQLLRRSNSLTDQDSPAPGLQSKWQRAVLIRLLFRSAEAGVPCNLEKWPIDDDDRQRPFSQVHCRSVVVSNPPRRTESDRATNFILLVLPEKNLLARPSFGGPSIGIRKGDAAIMESCAERGSGCEGSDQQQTLHGPTVFRASRARARTRRLGSLAAIL